VSRAGTGADRARTRPHRRVHEIVTPPLLNGVTRSGTNVVITPAIDLDLDLSEAAILIGGWRVRQDIKNGPGRFEPP
jgi:hypothetical protein